VSRVLLVEDEPDLRLLATMSLTLAGHDVVEAATGEAALEVMAGGTAFDVLVLDIRLPGISGWDVLVRLDEMGARTDLGVVIFSAHVGPELSRKADEFGADVYLTKPYEDQELLDAVARATRV
jgi:CheY-like chemotaxis protein